MTRAGAHQRFVDGDGEFGRDVQLPAELADISDAQRQDGRAGDPDRADLAERESAVGDVVCRDAFQHPPRVRSHQGERRVS